MSKKIGTDSQVFDAIKGFTIVQLKISKMPDGRGRIEIRGIIDKSKMTTVEKILEHSNRR